jgi:hypothetical protein
MRPWRERVIVGKDSEIPGKSKKDEPRSHEDHEAVLFSSTSDGLLAHRNAGLKTTAS